jgi:hypothetical protein
VTSVSPGAASFSATVDPGGQDTNWQLTVRAVNPAIRGTEPVRGGSVPAGTTVTSVTGSVSGLLGNTRYTAVLTAANGSGSAASQPVTFTAGELPALPITLAAQHLAVSIYSSPELTATIQGPTAAANAVDLEFAPAGSARYHVVDHALVSGSVVNFHLFEPVQNGTVRAVLTGREEGARYIVRAPSTSNSVSVTVTPKPVLTVVHKGAGTNVVLFYLVRPLPAGYVGEPVYFYETSSGSGPYRRFASARLRRERNALYGYVLGATARLSSSASAAVVDCVRHQVLPDMGNPFTDAACGNATLA